MPGGAVAGKTPLGSAASSYAARVGLFFAALFLIYGVHLPYLGVWLNSRGLSAGEISVVTAAPFFIRLVVTPAVCLAADRYDMHRRAIVALSVFALVMSLLLSQTSGFAAIFVTAVSFHLAAATIMPLTETVAVGGVKRYGLDYGRMRLWGSLSFIVATTAGGSIVGAWGAGAGVWLMAVGAAATVLASVLLPAPAPGAETARRLTLRDAGELASHPILLLFLVAVGAVQGAHALFYTFGALDWARQGIPGLWIGILWGIGVLVEVLLFAYSAAVLKRVSVMTLLIAGCAAAVLRWLAMAFEPAFILLFPLQFLHALTYGATHVAAIHFIGRAVPEAAAGTAQSLYATVAAGVAMGGATLLAGGLYESHGARAYLAMAVLAAIGLAAAIILARRWDGGVIRVG